MSISHLNKLKSAIKNEIEGTLNLSANIADDSNDKHNFPHKLLLINSQVSKLRKTFSNGSSANRKLIGLLGSLLTTGFPLIRNVPKPLAKMVLISLGFIAAAAGTDAAIHQKMFGSGFTTIIISN